MITPITKAFTKLNHLITKNLRNFFDSITPITVITAITEAISNFFDSITPITVITRITKTIAKVSNVITKDL